MGLWSSVKKGWRKIKGAARQVGRVIAEAAHRLIVGLPDLLLGFLAWPPKKLRIKILILSDKNKLNGGEVALPSDLTLSIDYAKRVFKDRLNVKLLPYPGTEKPMVEIITDPAPAAALQVNCGAGAWGEEFGEAGEFFADHLVGLVYPVTVFIVSDVIDKQGCSLGPLTDYVTMDPNGIKSGSTLAHEVAHACGLWHSGSKSNLMWSKSSSRGDGIKWWQKNLFRSSRHVTYW